MKYIEIGNLERVLLKIIKKYDYLYLLVFYLNIYYQVEILMKYFWDVFVCKYLN